jgi:hypothetical protein
MRPNKIRKTGLNTIFSNNDLVRTFKHGENARSSTENRLRRERNEAQKGHIRSHREVKRSHAEIKRLNAKVCELESKIAPSGVKSISFDSIFDLDSFSADLPFTRQASRGLFDMIREKSAVKIREINPSPDMSRYELYNKMGRSLDTQIGNGLEDIVAISGRYKKIWKDNQKPCHYQNDADNPYKQYGGKFADVANNLYTVELKSTIDSITKGFKDALLTGLKHRNNGTFTRKVRGQPNEPVPKYPARWVALFGTAPKRAAHESTFKLDTVEFWKTCGIDYFVLEKIWAMKFDLVEIEIHSFFKKC